MHLNFFIAGVQKSGTTALDAMLRRHPAIEMAAQKEPHFFDNDTLDWGKPDYGVLHGFYDRTGADRLRGEATPIYTYWPQSLERLKAYNPAAKLIVGLRHPAFRAFSHWRMETSRSAEELSFSDAIREGRQRVREAPGGVHRVYSYVERGFYSAQVHRLLSLFPREQIWFFRTDEFWRAPKETLDAVLVFLGAEAAPLISGAEYIVPVQSRPDLEFAGADRRYLLDLFCRDIERTAEATGLELTDWLASDYFEPMSPA